MYKPVVASGLRALVFEIHNGCLLERLYACTVVRLCGRMVVRLCICVVVWLCVAWLHDHGFGSMVWFFDSTAHLFRGLWFCG